MPYPWLTYAAVLPHCLMRGCGAGITLITDDSDGWMCTSCRFTMMYPSFFMQPGCPSQNLTMRTDQPH